jgi:hypothetical protein
MYSNTLADEGFDSNYSLRVVWISCQNYFTKKMHSNTILFDDFHKMPDQWFWYLLLYSDVINTVFYISSSSFHVTMLHSIKI